MNEKIVKQKLKKVFLNPWFFSALVVVVATGVLNHFYAVRVIKRSALDSASLSAPGRGEGPNPEKKEESELDINPQDLNMNFQNLSEKEREQALAYVKFKRIKDSFVPSGVPKLFYGKELGVNFDQVQKSMNKMRVYGPTYGKEDKK